MTELEFVKSDLKKMIVLECQGKYMLYNLLQKRDGCGLTPEIIFAACFAIARYHIEARYKQLGGKMDEINQFEVKTLMDLGGQAPYYTLENYKEKLEGYVQ